MPPTTGPSDPDRPLGEGRVSSLRADAHDPEAKPRPLNHPEWTAAVRTALLADYTEPTLNEALMTSPVFGLQVDALVAAMIGGVKELATQAIEGQRRHEQMVEQLTRMEARFPLRTLTFDDISAGALGSEQVPEVPQPQASPKRRFEQGDEVEVTKGPYRGYTGRVSGIETMGSWIRETVYSVWVVELERRVLLPQEMLAPLTKKTEDTPEGTTT